MIQGKIKRLTDRGFGFIAVEGKNDMFFHMSTLMNSQWDDLREGQAVEFQIGEGPKGPRAEQVKVL